MSLLIEKDIFTEEEAKFYTAELILAIESIHKLDCIHRDIKPDNILIDKTGHIKLSDFGLAKVSEKLYDKNNNIQDKNFNENKMGHQKNFSCVGTAYYVAPEVLNKKGYGQEIDWWSVGVIFFEMLCGYAPFCSKDTNEVCYKILNWQKFLKIPKQVQLSNEAQDLIFKMINNKNERLGKNGSEEIKKHPFFKGLDWNNIRNSKAPFIPKLKNDYDTKYFEKFEEIEPFYPPINKFNKRKDMQFIGFTYKEEDDDEQNLNDEYENAIQIIDDIKNINDDSFNNNYITTSSSEKENNGSGEVMKRIKIEKNKNNNSRNNSPNSNKGKRMSASPKKDEK